MRSIRLARVRAGLTQAQLAARTGIDQASVSRMERGRQTVSVAQLTLIAQALAVTPAALLEADATPGRVA